jgi:hypothetical protein
MHTETAILNTGHNKTSTHPSAISRRSLFRDDCDMVVAVRFYLKLDD